MLQYLRTTSGRMAIAVIATSSLVALWLVYDLPIAIVYVLIVPIWLSLFVRQEQPVSPRARGFMVAALVVGLVLVLVLGALYLYVAQG